MSRPVRRDVARVLGTHVIHMGPRKQVAAGARKRRATRSQSSIQRSDQRTNRGGLGFGATDREEQEERDQKGPCYVQRNHGLVRTHWWPPMKRKRQPIMARVGSGLQSRLATVCFSRERTDAGHLSERAPRLVRMKRHVQCFQWLAPPVLPLKGGGTRRVLQPHG